MNNKSKKLAFNTIVFLIGNLGAKLIQFLLVPLYTYTLSTSDYGISEILFTSINFLIPIFSVSIADGYLRYGLDKKYNKDDITNIALKIVFKGSIFSIICIPLFMKNNILSNWIIYFLAILNLRMYRDIFAIRLKIYEYNKLYAIDSILYTFILCLSSYLLLAVCDMGVAGYLLAYVIANICSIMFIIWLSKFNVRSVWAKTDKILYKEIIKYSLPMIVNGIAWWVTNASDKFMLEYMMSNAAVGIYSIAAKIPSFITTFTGIFSQAWTVSSVVEYDNEREKNFYSITFRRYYEMLFIWSSFLILIIKPFLAFYVNDIYFEAWKYAPLLIAGAISSGVVSFTVGIYSALKKNINVTITTVIGGIMNLILNFILIKRLGIMGATIATFVAWTIIVILRLWDIKKIFYFKVDYLKLLILYILIIAECIIIINANEMLAFFIAALIVSCILYISRGTINEILSSIKNKIFERKKNNG